jgi:hypothetical protein
MPQEFTIGPSQDGQDGHACGGALPPVGKMVMATWAIAMLTCIGAACFASVYD